MKLLKSLLVTAAMLGVFAFSAVGQTSEDAISKYFNKYLEDERFTVVYISPKMFELFDNMNLELDDEEAQAIKSVVKDLRGLRILVAEDADTRALYNEAASTINTKEYETLMTVRNKNQDDVQFLIKDEGSEGAVINELLLLVGSSDTFVLMSFIGQIDLNNISKLSEAFDGDDDDDDNNNRQ